MVYLNLALQNLTINEPQHQCTKRKRKTQNRFKRKRNQQKRMKINCRKVGDIDVSVDVQSTILHRTSCSVVQVTAKMPAAKKQMPSEHNVVMTDEHGIDTIDVKEQSTPVEHDVVIPTAKEQISEEHGVVIPVVKHHMSADIPTAQEEMSAEHDAATTAAKNQIPAELCNLIAPSRVGATRLEVNHVHGRSLDELVVINRGQNTAELATVTVSGTGSITVRKPLLYEHRIGEEVDFADINDDYISMLRFAEKFSTAFKEDTTRVQVNHVYGSGLTTTTVKSADPCVLTDPSREGVIPTPSGTDSVTTQELDKLLMPPPPPR